MFEFAKIAIIKKTITTYLICEDEILMALM
jgi:hypothetical protein